MVLTLSISPPFSFSLFLFFFGSPDIVFDTPGICLSSIFVFVSHCIVLDGLPDIVLYALGAVPDAFLCSAFWSPQFGLDVFPGSAFGSPPIGFDAFPGSAFGPPPLGFDAFPGSAFGPPLFGLDAFPGSAFGPLQFWPDAFPGTVFL